MNSTVGDEVWLLPWGLGQRSGSSKENKIYVRTDGQPIVSAQARAVLAQCQDEGARSAFPWEYTNACMARNGYVAQKRKDHQGGAVSRLRLTSVLCAVSFVFVVSHRSGLGQRDL
jgi:hypothetical protein